MRAAAALVGGAGRSGTAAAAAAYCVRTGWSGLGVLCVV